METQLVRIVNKGLENEPQHACFQNKETNEIYEFSQIIGEDINDSDLSHPIIQTILNNGHEVSISVDENNNVTLHF
jgi:hypothetical protein